MNEPAPIDLLVTNGTVITVDAERRIFADGAVAVSDEDVADAQRYNAWGEVTEGVLTVTVAAARGRCGPARPRRRRS